MQPQELNQLIEKYYEGLTSLKEEMQLLDWLRTSPEGGAYADVLAQLEIMLQLNTDIKTDPGFDQQIIAALQVDQPMKNRWLQTSRLTGIAATVLVFLAVWIGSELLKPTEVYGTINDPKLAFNETTRILDKVSGGLNKGLKPAQQSTEKLVKGLKKVEKAIEKSNQLNEVNKASQYLNSFTRVYIKLGHKNNKN
ncbi:MAG: hypothetical protein A2W85_08970 [Bacteroidetes bacterium GWF2_41_31]|nr:MAG: hypothetical protein A2W85_08970 [Bacteroidetes bacterium GWF2_41_31]OFZ09865.1 MAG: hypothetical protein A2338_06810 [Bacteroidetes bacterium RIFOXYB12_FULL_41_6]